MASDQLFALKYAKAFASAASGAGLDASIAEWQMGEFAGLLRDSRELREVLTDPSIPASEKLAVIDAIAARGGMYREVRNFIAVVVEHRRLGGLNEIIAEYHRLADAGQGLTEAEVTSARALNDEDRGLLERKVAELAGSRVRVTWREDAALLGGAVVTIGSTVYDGSVRAQLEQMKQALISA